MKIQLIEEHKVGEATWYSIYKDENYVKGTSDKKKALEWYNMIVNDEKAFETKKIVLMSEEISVPSQETNS